MDSFFLSTFSFFALLFLSPFFLLFSAKTKVVPCSLFLVLLVSLSSHAPTYTPTYINMHMQHLCTAFAVYTVINSTLHSLSYLELKLKLRTD